MQQTSRTAPAPVTIYSCGAGILSRCAAGHGKQRGSRLPASGSDLQHALASLERPLFAKLTVR